MLRSLGRPTSATILQSRLSSPRDDSLLDPGCGKDGVCAQGGIWLPGMIIEQQTANILSYRLVLTTGVESNVPINFIVYRRAHFACSLARERAEELAAAPSPSCGTGMEPTFHYLTFCILQHCRPDTTVIGVSHRKSLRASGFAMETLRMCANQTTDVTRASPSTHQHANQRYLLMKTQVDSEIARLSTRRVVEFARGSPASSWVPEYH